MKILLTEAGNLLLVEVITHTATVPVSALLNSNQAAEFKSGLFFWFRVGFVLTFP